MSGFLQEIITDENLVWDKSLGNKPEKFFVKLSSKTICSVMIYAAKKNIF
jgi:hypothetical protein